MSDMQTTLRALADPTRREILTMLKSGRLSAGEIGEGCRSWLFDRYCTYSKT